MFNSDLVTDIKKEQGSDLGKLLRKLAQGQRPQTQDVNYDLAVKDAEQIYKVEFLKIRKYNKINYLIDK